MKKSELRQIISEEYQKLTEGIKDYEDVLNHLTKAVDELERAERPDDRTLEKQVDNFSKKLEKLVDQFENLTMKLDKKI